MRQEGREDWRQRLAWIMNASARLRDEQAGTEALRELEGHACALVRDIFGSAPEDGWADTRMETEACDIAGELVANETFGSGALMRTLLDVFEEYARQVKRPGFPEGHPTRIMAQMELSPSISSEDLRRFVCLCWNSMGTDARARVAAHPNFSADVAREIVFPDVSLSELRALILPRHPGLLRDTRFLNTLLLARDIDCVHFAADKLGLEGEELLDQVREGIAQRMGTDGGGRRGPAECGHFDTNLLRLVEEGRIKAAHLNTDELIALLGSPDRTIRDRAFRALGSERLDREPEDRRSAPR